MERYHHLNVFARANISLFLNQGRSPASIARELNLSKSTVVREIIRNRTKIENGTHYGRCPLLRNKCSVCNACKRRATCMLVQYIYRDGDASAYASARKHLSNSGPRISLSGFESIDKELDELVARKGQSIEAAWHSSPILQKVSPLTLRRWVCHGFMTVKVAYLRRTRRYRNKDRYDYSRLKSSLNYTRMPLRTIGDYRDFIGRNPDSVTIQTDSVEGKSTDRKAILTVFHSDSRLQAGYLYDRGNSANEVYALLKRHTKRLLKSIGGDRPIVFVTDNGVEFASISLLEKLSPRVKVFFARPYCSTDKAGCERNHELYRYVFPKGRSFDGLTQEKVSEIFSNVNSYVRESLDWKSPCMVSAEAYGEKFLSELNLSMIPPRDVKLRPLF